METHIALSSIQVLDLLFRFATFGCLLMLFIVIANNGEPSRRIASMSLVICIASYVLLTAPINDEHYGWLRPILLLLTNCTPYALLAVYWHKVRATSVLAIFPLWAKGVALVWFAWLVWFFVIESGVGDFRRWHLGISLIVIVLIVLEVLRVLDDDLVESRRETQKQDITFVSVYAMFLSVIEIFFRTIKDDAFFSIVNALMMMIVTCYFSYRTQKQIIIITSGESLLKEVSKKTPSPVINPNVKKLTDLMQQEVYKQNGLTVSKLSTIMELPEHQLRVLINKELGFDNFSQFLNSHRIPAVCKMLEQAEYQNTPILTLALDTGYNSITPFNRAFKELKGMTPTQYRHNFAVQFQK